MLHDYVATCKLLQLATLHNGKPWICTVYFVTDDQNNIYWLSYPERRHSQDVEADNRVAATIVVEADLPVVGIQIEGTAAVVTDKQIVKSVLDKYVAKYDSGKTFYERFVAGENRHQLYKLTPDTIYLFDERSTNISDRQLVV